MEYSYLLTIAIPTYNRAQYLDICLQQICGQLKDENHKLVELIVSDNASIDQSKDIVEKYITSRCSIRYIRNERNIGPDRNITQCFEEAKGKYVLVLGDDDILLDGALDKIIKIIQEKNYGIIYLNSYGFKDDFIKEMPVVFKGKFSVEYENSNAFLKKLNYYITFISGNICNMSLVDEKINFKNFEGTFLGQVPRYISALLNAKVNLYVKEALIAAKANNTGGYKLFEVFGKNFNEILIKFRSKGLKSETIAYINYELIMNFFPGFILRSRINKAGFDTSMMLQELYIQYKNSILFWIILNPLIKLPMLGAKMYYLGIKIMNKLWRFVLIGKD